jgi:RHS repeat-associated protein
VITDSAGVTKAESDYYPWGGELQFVANDSNDYKFTGKKRDIETGLDYFGARYYSNGLGRWVSADWSVTPIPVPYADFGDPQSLNGYTYVRNIPTTNIDTDGHQQVSDEIRVDMEYVRRTFNNLKPLAPVAAPAVAAVPAIVPVAVLSSPSLGAMILVATQPPMENHPADDPPSDSNMMLDALNPPYVAAPPAQGQTQTEEPPPPAPAPASGGAQKGGGPKPGSKDGPGSGKRATPSQRDAALKENGGKCVFCGKKATEVDHSIPKSKNGDTTTENLQPTCQHCNRQKGAKTSTEYEKWKKDQDNK